MNRPLRPYSEAQERGSPTAQSHSNGGISRYCGLRGSRKAKRLNIALKVVQLFPNDGVSRSSLALALRDRGRYSDAVRQYQASLRCDGKNTRTILGYLATLCLTSAGARGALEYLEDRLRIMPENVSLLNAKANYLRRAGLFSESLGVAEKLINDHPTYTPARCRSAGTLVAMGKIEEARRILPIAQTLRSELDWLGPRLSAMAFAAEGHFAEAAETLEFALESCPWRRELSRIRTTLGFIQMKLGKEADSVMTLERDLMSLDEASKQVRLVLLGQAQILQGNYSVANTLLGNMVSTKDDLLSPLRQKYLASIHDVHRNIGEIPDRAEIQLLLAA